MKITRIHLQREKLALSRPYTISYETISATETCFVRVETDRGLIGTGAGNPNEKVTGESMDSCHHALKERTDWLIGEDVRALPALLRQLRSWLPKNPAARAAIDMALYDLLAQSLEVPLVTMLGSFHDAMPTSITIGIKAQDEALREAQEYFDRGFRFLKIKLGKDLEQDVELLHKLRERFKSSIHIRVDANQGYETEEFMTFWQKTQELDLELIEQPLKAGKENEMKELPEVIKSHIAVDESLLNYKDAFRLSSPPRACGIFNVKMMKCGGIGPSLQIATIARAADIDLMWGCDDESIVSVTAALHAALATPGTRYIDLDGSLDLARDRVEGGFVLKDGVMSVTDAPGLGVQWLEK
jgi:L-alanine-DL-glutamate epimerase-like enolase superfamily enzyme